MSKMAKKKAKPKPRAAGQLLLSSALLAGSTLRPMVQIGMGAFIAKDRPLIALTERPRIGDSLNLDAALQNAFPNAHRWDYIFSVSDAGTLLALEPHSATDHEIKVVIAKKQNAAAQLRAHLQAKHHVSDWLWVSHGPTSFSKMEPATRRLAQAGIKYVGRSVRKLG